MYMYTHFFGFYIARDSQSREASLGIQLSACVEKDTPQPSLSPM